MLTTPNNPLARLLSSLIILIVISSGCSKKSVDNQTTITSIRPSSAGAGDTVTVYGKNFSTDLTRLKITVNGKPVQLIALSQDSLKFIVPQTLGSGTVVLSMDGSTVEGPDLTYKYQVIVTTLAGSGAVGSTDGASGLASFNCPWGITADINGDLYVADCYNRLIRKISGVDSSVSSIIIPSPINGTDNFYSPYNIALDQQTHNLFLTDFNLHVMKVTPAQQFSVIYSDSMPMAGIGVAPDGFLYVTNNTSGTITKMDKDGQNRSIFTTGLITPRNIIFDKNGVMYVSAYGIYKIGSNGNVLGYSLDQSFKGWEIAMDTSGVFYEADHFNNVIRRIDKNGTATTIAGNGAAADIDGIGLDASFNGPQGMTIDQNGNLYVTTYNYDTQGGNKIRKISFR